jgi:hypothetical protein
MTHLITAQLVSAVVLLLEGVVLPVEEAASLARLVGSRPELLAHLLVCRHSFRAYPDIVEELHRAAAEVGPGPTTDRPDRPDNAARRRADYRQLDAALRDLFALTAESDTSGKAAEALRRFGREGLARPPR